LKEAKPDSLRLAIEFSSVVQPCDAQFFFGRNRVMLQMNKLKGRNNNHFHHFVVSEPYPVIRDGQSRRNDLDCCVSEKGSAEGTILQRTFWIHLITANETEIEEIDKKGWNQQERMGKIDRIKL
jgi:hypothetical protein